MTIVLTPPLQHTAENHESLYDEIIQFAEPKLDKSRLWFDSISILEEEIDIDGSGTSSIIRE
jgi:hypothetical protein